MSDILQLLSHLSSLQSRGQSKYAAGLFPSQRINRYLLYRREDDTIFFSLLIAFTLKRLLPYLTEEEQKTATQMIQGVVKNYPSYKNKKGLDTYNYWHTHNFPNGWLMHKFKSFRLPDDADDTVLIYLTDPQPHEINVWLKEKLIFHANGTHRQCDTGLEHYLSHRAYDTWFGKNMSVTLDICVLCNILYFVLDKKLDWSVQDEDSLRMIEGVLERKEYLSHSLKVSPYYIKPVVILYHMARLASSFSDARLNRLRELLPDHLQALYEHTHAFPDHLLLATAQAFLGISNDQFELPVYNPGLFKGFYFYRLGVLSAFKQKWIKPWADRDFFLLQLPCEAYHLCLYLEHKVFRRTLEKQNAHVVP